MSNIRRHGDRSQIIERFPDAEYADRLRLVRWRRSPTNPVYEAQVKLPGQEQWSAPFSLKTENRDRALFAAVREFGRRKQLQDAGLPMPARKKPVADRAENTFGDAARIVMARLKDKRATTLAAEGRQKANKHEQHIGRIGRMLREFEAVPVAEITGGRLHDWLASLQVGRPGRMHAPGQSTVGNFAASFAMVMDAAVKTQWMRAEDVPKITRRGFAAPVPRTWFTHAEVCQLRDHMTDEWCADAHRHRSQHLRVLLRAYVALASCTGIRPGLELELLHENQIIEERHQGNPVIRIPIRANQAKYKKAREVIVFENDAFDIRAALRTLRLFRRRDELPATGLLFSCPVAGRVPGFARPFHRLLEQTGLVVDPESGLDRVPYSLRHYFATQALLRPVEDHVVARWMGTSTLMLDKHYSKVKVRMMAARLAGTLDKPARLRAALERDIAARRLEPTVVLSPEDDDPELLDLGHQDAAGGTKAA